MPERIRDFLRKYGYWLSLLAGLAGGAYFVWQSWGYVHTLASDVLDESLYFYKGYVFAIGKYKPFADYGPLTNHMPLSFMIPGWVQNWFGPGLRTGRMYVFALGIVMIAGYWMAAYRIGGTWWAAGIVWAVALSGFWVQLFSLGVVQGLVNALLAWMLVFAFDQRGRWWQMALAGIFAGLLVTTRINMLPVAFFFVLYAFWLHGWRAGLAAALGTALTVGVVHAFYWPDILKLWAYWIPEGRFAFIDRFRSPWRQFTGVKLDFFPLKDIWENKQRPEWNAWRAFWRGMRFNFLATFGVIVALLLSTRKRALVSEFHRKTAIFLITSYLVLMGMHMWAALTARSCTFFCFENYIAFYMLLGLLAVVASSPQWPVEISFAKEFSALLITIAFVTGVNYAADFNYTPYKRTIFGFLKDGLPWLREYIGAADIPLWTVLQNKFGFDYYAFVRLYPDLPQYFPLAEGILLVVLVIPIAYVLLSSIGFRFHSFGRFVLLFTLVLAFVFSPSKRLSGKTDTLDCKTDVIQSYEQVGEELGEVIPAGSLVYWHVKSNNLLLYLPEVDIFPPQLNLYFSEIEGDDYSQDELDSMLRYGFWNQQLDDQWQQEADYIVVEKRYLASGQGEWQSVLDSGKYDVVMQTDSVEACRGEQAEILVLQEAGSAR